MDLCCRFTNNPAMCSCGGTVKLVCVDGSQWPINSYNDIKNSISHMQCDKCGVSYYVEWDINIGVPKPVYDFNGMYRDFLYKYENSK